MALISGPDCVISGSSTSPALRVTQTGTGDVLRIEDAANPDSTPLRVDGDGTVLMEAGNVTIGGTAISANTRFTSIINNSTYGAAWVEKSLGASGQVTDGTRLGIIGSRGYTTSAGGTASGAYIDFNVDETLGSVGGAPPTRIDVRSDPDGNGTDICMSVLGGVKLHPKSTSDWENARADNSGSSVILGGGAGGNTPRGIGIRTFFAEVNGVGTTFVNSGLVLPNTRAVYLIVVEGYTVGGGNGFSTACYISTVGAYSKTLTQLGSTSNHFGNGTVQAQLTTTSAYNVDIQVKASNSNSWTITTTALRVH